MKKFKELTYWLFMNGAMAYLLYIAFSQQLVWAENIVKFMTTFSFILCLLVLCCLKDAQKKAREEGTVIPETLRALYGFAYASTFAAMGWFGYAGMSIFVTCIKRTVYHYNEED